MTDEPRLADRLCWLRELADTPTIPEETRARAAALLEQYGRLSDLGWPPLEAWDRAVRHTHLTYGWTP